MHKNDIKKYIRYLAYFKHYFIKTLPAELTFFVTDSCNARCRHCFHYQETDVGNESVLSVKEIDEIFSNINYLLRIIFSGGESFLRNDLGEIIKIVCNKARPLHVSLPTNGLLTDRIKNILENVLPYCSKTLFSVNISLLGLQGKHDERINVPGGFNKILKTYKMLKKMEDKFPNLITGIIITQTGSNQNELQDIYDFSVNELECNNISFLLIRGDVIYQEELNIDINIYDRMIQYIKNNQVIPDFLFSSLFLEARYEVYKYVSRIYKQSRHLISCLAGMKRFVLSSRGDIFPCEMLMLEKNNKPYKIGNVREVGYNIERIIKSKKYRRKIKKINNRYCYCTHECDLLTNIMFNPLIACQLFIKTLMFKFLHTFFETHFTNY